MAKIMISLPQESLRTLLSESQGDRRSWKEALALPKELEQRWVGRWNSTDIARYYRE